ncbi:MAG: sigma-70 family RNA polymerase sigma factor [SAR324 cluster bacterium]|nr:sigma-70 family RNA polymerase sigma factor [SAR324 cluster bacterium]
MQAAHSERTQGKRDVGAGAGEREKKNDAKEASRQKDRELITSMKDGDQSAFPQLVSKYQRQVYNHCQRMVNDEEESYDLTQEVFLRVFRNIKNYQHNYSFYTWLYRITVNCCIDYLRKKKRKPATVSLSQGYRNDRNEPGRDQDYPDTKFVPDKTALNRELNQVLNDAIGKLSEKLRVIIVLKEIEGFSYDEIAEILVCSRGTVKSRLFRARERLKELLGPYFTD